MYDRMGKESNVLSTVAIFVAGAVAAGLVAGRRRDKAPAAPAVPASPLPHPGDSVAVLELRRALVDLENRVAVQESSSTQRFGQIEARIEEQSAKLAELPSTQQIVSAMEQLLAKTMASLDDRLTTQAQSIEVLKTTVSQTDSLLERVLESLDSLQTYAEPVEPTEDTLLHRPAV